MITRGPTNAIIEEAYRRSLDLLKRNSTRHGILASSAPDTPNYRAIWGRDGSICAAAACLCDDEEVRQAGIRTLRTLADHQGRNGQIPSYVVVDEHEEILRVVYGGLGRVVTIDSNLWFLIAAQTAFRQGFREFIEDHLMDVYLRALRHLYSNDSDQCGLLEVPTAGDWSDILGRSYHVLYDQALWYRALKCAAWLCHQRNDEISRDRAEDHSQKIARLLNQEFWWDREGMARARESYYIENPIDDDQVFPYYQAYLKPFANLWYKRFDAFANVLTALSGIAPHDRVCTIIEKVIAQKLDRPHPIRVLDPPVRPGDGDWQHIFEQHNSPYDYHNGASWPLAGGFWVVLLDAVGRKEKAREELRRLAEALRVSRDGNDQWEFTEYFHGETGKPSGYPHQSWNAASFIFAYHAHMKSDYACFEAALV